MSEKFLAVDIGASSGRHIVGFMENGKLMTEEVFRFPNGVKEENGHLVWDVDKIFAYVEEGIRKAVQKFPDIVSLSIDTWGVDYVLLKGDKEITPCFAYRDNRTEEVIPEVHDHISFSDLYRHTGSQFQPFNSLYQFYADKKAGRLQSATDFLMIPEYLMWRLTGVKKHEFTNATTTGMISAKTLSYDEDIIRALDLPKELFKPLSKPGETVGTYEVEGHTLEVVLCATHDTGSAVEGIPMEGEEIYISSGTWSLLGVKTPAPITDEASEKANYSNEGGPSYNRYQKNISGMWLVQNLQKELCPDKDFVTIAKEAEESTCRYILDVSKSEFLAPKSMKQAFLNECTKKYGEVSLSEADYFAIAYRSLAALYNEAILELENNTKKKYSSVYIVGGGAKNGFYCRLTEEATGKKVIALPIEATAIGNLYVQIKAREQKEAGK